MTTMPSSMPPKAWLRDAEDKLTLPAAGNDVERLTAWAEEIRRTPVAGERRWTLERFPEELSLWVEREDPADGLVLAVRTGWSSAVHTGSTSEPAVSDATTSGF